MKEYFKLNRETINETLAQLGASAKENIKKYTELNDLIKKIYDNYKPSNEKELNIKNHKIELLPHTKLDIRLFYLVKEFLSSIEHLELNKHQFSAILDYIWLMTRNFKDSPFPTIVALTIIEKRNIFLVNRIRDYINSRGIMINLDDEELCKSIVEGFNKEYVINVINRK